MSYRIIYVLNYRKRFLNSIYETYYIIVNCIYDLIADIINSFLNGTKKLFCLQKDKY